MSNPTDGTADNFGWPCYEGRPAPGGLGRTEPQPLREPVRPGLASGAAPYFRYPHNELDLPSGVCPRAAVGFVVAPRSTPAGRTRRVQQRSSSPTIRGGASSSSRPVRRAAGPGEAAQFSTQVGELVDLQIGPGGDLYYVDGSGVTIHHIRYFPSSHPSPSAIAHAPTTGAAPLTVRSTATLSSDPDGDPLSYAWDLDGDGAFDDTAAATASYTYTIPGTYLARLQVSDGNASATATVSVSAGNTPPRPVIDAPTGSTTWKVGDTISFSGRANDDQDGALSASALSWSLLLQHCPSTCHQHPLQTYPGVADGSFVAPDHEYPAHLELRLSATDSSGLTATTSLRLDPQTVVARLREPPARPHSGRRLHESGHPVQPHRHHGIDGVGERSVTTDAGWQHVPMEQLVGRWHREPHRLRIGGGHLHGELRARHDGAGDLEFVGEDDRKSGHDYLDDERPGRHPGAVRPDHDLRLVESARPHVDDDAQRHPRRPDATRNLLLQRRQPQCPRKPLLDERHVPMK